MKRVVLLLLLILLPAARGEEEFKTVRQWQFGVGPAFTTGLNTPYMITGWRFGFGVQMNPAYDFQIVADWAFSNTNTDMRFFTLALASNYYFSDGKTSPFVTVDVGYGTAHAHWDCNNYTCQDPADDASGAALGAGAGYKFFRGSEFNLSLLARYNVLLATTRRGTPSKSTVSAVLYY